jgi:phospholipase/carboxylesterase
MKEICDKYDIQSDQIILGGFSQGGMMTYYYGLSNPDIIRGFAALSSKILFPESLQPLLPDDKTQKIFISHGIRDIVIPVDYGRDACQFLEDAGYKPIYKEYDMHHEISGGTIVDLLEWCEDVMPPIELPTEDQC